MSTITSFADFKIATPVKKFIGDKLKMKNIIGKKIVVNHYKIEPSKFPEKGDGQRLCMQFTLDGNNHIVFTSGTMLKEVIAQVPSFPFETIIIEKNEILYFT